MILRTFFDVFWLRFLQFYGRTQYPAFLQGTAMASLLGQLPTWIAVTVSTWVACWIFVAPQKCQDVAVFGSSKKQMFYVVAPVFWFGEVFFFGKETDRFAIFTFLTKFCCLQCKKWWGLRPAYEDLSSIYSRHLHNGLGGNGWERDLWPHCNLHGCQAPLLNLNNLTLRFMEAGHPQKIYAVNSVSTSKVSKDHFVIKLGLCMAWKDSQLMNNLSFPCFFSCRVHTRQTQSLIPHLQSRCLPSFLLAVMFSWLAVVERIFSLPDMTLAHVHTSADGLTPMGRPVYTMRYVEPLS